MLIGAVLGKGVEALQSRGFKEGGWLPKSISERKKGLYAPVQNKDKGKVISHQKFRGGGVSRAVPIPEGLTGLTESWKT